MKTDVIKVVHALHSTCPSGQAESVAVFSRDRRVVSCSECLAIARGRVVSVGVGDPAGLVREQLGAVVSAASVDVPVWARDRIGGVERTVRAAQLEWDPEMGPRLVLTF